MNARTGFFSILLLAASACSNEVDVGDQDAGSSAGGSGGSGGTPTVDGGTAGWASTAGSPGTGGGGLAPCTDTTADCDGDPANGCEADLTSRTSCGTCTLVCGPGLVCAAGACVAESCVPSPEICDGLDNDCNGVVDDGPNCNEPCVEECSGDDAGTSCSCARKCPDGSGYDFRCSAQDRGMVCTCSNNGRTATACAFEERIDACEAMDRCCRSTECVPSPEVCDGLDNDCNGVVDDGLTCNCEPALPCNWCNGATLYDPSGCVTGYVCANGADPCETMPCDPGTNDGCERGTVCGPDMLCWPREPAECTGAGTSDPNGLYCSTSETCSDGTSREYACNEDLGVMLCTCTVDDRTAAECSFEMPIRACDALAECCGELG